MATVNHTCSTKHTWWLPQSREIKLLPSPSAKFQHALPTLRSAREDALFPQAGKRPHLTPESSVLGNIQFSQQNTGLILSCRNQNVTCHSRFLCVVVAAADQSIIFFCFHIRIIIQLFSSFTRIIHVMALWSGKCHQQENMVIFIIRHVLYMLVMYRSTVMVRDKAPAACAREAEHQPLRR